MMIPQVLVGRYEVGRLLGSGGMAEVYEGTDRLLDRRVAIKILRSQYASDPAFLERFRREAQSAAAFSHPNIVAVYDTGMEGAVPFIVMEYVEGRTLKEVIAAEGALPPSRAAEIGAQVAAALAAAHLRGLVHRDVKPGNVMLTADGTAKVTDFGIARVETASPLTQPAAVVGTAQYIAPEQAEGRGVDGRSDIYSLGCVLYELLTGQVPFSGPTPVAIAYRHVQDQVVPPRLLNPHVPPELEAVVLKALAKRPEDRYQTAAQLAADLDRVRAAPATPLFAATPATGPAEQTTQYLPPAPTAAGPPAPSGAGPAKPAATRVLSTPIDPSPVGSRAARYADTAALDEPGGNRRLRTALLIGGGLLFTALLTLAVASMVIKSVSGGGNNAASTQTSQAATLPTDTTPSTELPTITTTPPPSAPLIASTTTPSTTAPPTSAPASTTSSSQSGTVIVPNVFGLREPVARARLQALGLQVTEFTVPAPRRFDGRVVQQFPRPGTQVGRGSTIQLGIGRFP